MNYIQCQNLTSGQKSGLSTAVSNILIFYEKGG